MNMADMVLVGHVAWFDLTIAVRRGRMCETGVRARVAERTRPQVEL